MKAHFCIFGFLFMPLLGHAAQLLSFPLLEPGQTQWRLLSEYKNSQRNLPANLEQESQIYLKSLNEASPGVKELKEQGLAASEPLGTVKVSITESSLSWYPQVAMGLSPQFTLGLSLQVAERATSINESVKFKKEYSNLSATNLKKEAIYPKNLKSNGEGPTLEQAQVVGHYLLANKNKWIVGSQSGFVVPTNTSYRTYTLAQQGSSRGQVDLNQQLYFRHQAFYNFQWGLSYQYTAQLENQMSVIHHGEEGELDSSVTRDSGDIQMLHLLTQLSAHKNWIVKGELMQIEKYHDRFSGDLPDKNQYKLLAKGSSYKSQELKLGVEFQTNLLDSDYRASLTLQSPLSEFAEATVNTTQVDFKILY